MCRKCDRAEITWDKYERYTKIDINFSIVNQHNNIYSAAVRPLVPLVPPSCHDQRGGKGPQIMHSRSLDISRLSSQGGTNERWELPYFEFKSFIQVGYIFYEGGDVWLPCISFSKKGGGWLPFISFFPATVCFHFQASICFSPIQIYQIIIISHQTSVLSLPNSSCRYTRASCHWMLLHRGCCFSSYYLYNCSPYHLFLLMTESIRVSCMPCYW